MNMNLKIKRIYNLGNYSNVEFTEELNEIPEKLLFNKEAMDKFRKLLMLNVEVSYNKYLEVNNKKAEDSEHEQELISNYLEQLDK